MVPPLGTIISAFSFQNKRFLGLTGAADEDPCPAHRRI